MTVGMPGAAIGGLFYVVSAVCAPLVAGIRWLRQRDARARHDVAVAWRQAAIAWGIIGVTLGIGWILAASLARVHGAALYATRQPLSLARPVPTPHGVGARAILRTVAFLLSLGTLAAVVTGAQLLQFVFRPRPTPLPETAPAKSVLDIATTGVAVFLAVLLGWGSPARADVRSLVAHGDSALAAGNPAAACRDYDAALAVDPQASRALFQRGRVARDAKEACIWLRRYVAVQPRDAWGWMALGDYAGKARHWSEANAAYARAVVLAPKERDAVIGQARILARSGRTDAAIDVYTQWLRQHPEDTEAWVELARAQRRAGDPVGAARTLEHAAPADAGAVRALEIVRSEAAPVVEPTAQHTSDSDENTRNRWGLAADVALPRGARAGIQGGELQVADPVQSRQVRDIGLHFTWRPSAALRLEAAPERTQVESVPRRGRVAPVPATSLATGTARIRWREPKTGIHFDVAGRRELLDASVDLLDARVVRSEGSVRLDVPLRYGVGVRGGGRLASYDGAVPNTRRGWSAALVYAGTPPVEWSVTTQESWFDHPSAAGYFAPQRVQSSEVGSYMELERGRLTWSLDLGAGVERITSFGENPGAWDASLRGWTQVAIALRPGCAIRFEGEADDSRAAAESSASNGWRYGFAAASLRWALR